MAYPLWQPEHSNRQTGASDMNRWAITIMIGAVSILLFSRVEPLRAATGYIFAGQVAAPDGRPVPGAEIRILDAFGKECNHVFSDLQGR